VVRITAIGAAGEKKARRSRKRAEAAPDAVASGAAEPALAGEVTVE
jgi:hypothetical protein